MGDEADFAHAHGGDDAVVGEDADCDGSGDQEPKAGLERRQGFARDDEQHEARGDEDEKAQKAGLHRGEGFGDLAGGYVAEREAEDATDCK